MGNCIDNSDNPTVYIYMYEKSYDGQSYHRYKKYIYCSDVSKYGEHKLKYNWDTEYRGHKRNKIINDEINYNKYIKWKNKNNFIINIKCLICKIYNSPHNNKFNISKDKTICVCCMDIKNNILFTNCAHQCLCLQCCKYINDSLIKL